MALAAATLETNDIKGEWLPGTSDTMVDIINPANQQSLAHFGPVLTGNESHTVDEAVLTLSKTAFGNAAAISPAMAGQRASSAMRSPLATSG